MESLFYHHFYPAASMDEDLATTVTNKKEAVVRT